MRIPEACGHWSRIAAVVAAVLGTCIPRTVTGQSQIADGQGLETLAGGLLGAYSGSMLGLVGALEPCNRTLEGTVCARIATIGGGLVGATSGAVLASRNTHRLHDRVDGMVSGALIGSAVGLGLMLGVRQYGWYDVLAASAVGAGLGGSPKGAGLGFVAGASAGVVLWALIPDVGPPDALGLGLVGLAVGGLAGWVEAATRGERSELEIVLPTVQIQF